MMKSLPTAISTAALSVALALSLALAGCASATGPGGGDPPSTDPVTTGPGSQGPGGQGADGPGADVDDSEIVGIDLDLFWNWVVKTGSDDFQIATGLEEGSKVIGVTLYDDGTARLIIISNDQMSYSEPYLTWQADGQRLVIMEDGSPAVSSITGAAMRGTYIVAGLQMTFTLQTGQQLEFGVMGE
jgi:hypothetical protein